MTEVETIHDHPRAAATWHFLASPCLYLMGVHSSKGFPHLHLIESIQRIEQSELTIGFVIKEESQSYQELKEATYLTLNHVHQSWIKKAHHAGIELPADESSFDACQLTLSEESPMNLPFVKESKIKLGVKCINDVTINSTHHYITAQIVYLDVDDALLNQEDQIDPELTKGVCKVSETEYFKLNKFKTLEKANPNNQSDLNKKERPDQVVFDDESQTYHSSLLPYGTNVGAPSIKVEGLSSWKSSSINSFNHHFNSKVDDVKERYKQLLDEYEINSMLYEAKMNFEPVVGKPYHLYHDDRKNQNFLSLIPPNSWKKEHLGTFRLNHERLWEKLPSDVTYD